MNVVFQTFIEYCFLQRLAVGMLFLNALSSTLYYKIWNIVQWIWSVNICMRLSYIFIKFIINKKGICSLSVFDTFTLLSNLQLQKWMLTLLKLLFDHGKQFLTDTNNTLTIKVFPDPTNLSCDITFNARLNITIVEMSLYFRVKLRKLNTYYAQYRTL